MPNTVPVVRFPRKLQVLFIPKRKKVLKGGRGSAKSWGVARALLSIALQRKVRIVCGREFQNSISESVHQLLKEQIELMGYGPWYTVQDTVITTKKQDPAQNSEFIFVGCRHNISKIKSMEGVDIFWIEEAEKLSKNSLEVIIPTVRKEGSEIWVTFNPDEESDPIWQYFCVNTPPDTVIVDMNWMDNPFLPKVLKDEKDFLYRTDPEAAEHIWGGGLRRGSAAQIFKGKYVVEDFTPITAEDDPSNAWSGPYFGQDFGYSIEGTKDNASPAATIKCWINKLRLYIEYEAYGYGVEQDDLPRVIKSIPGAATHTIRADCSRPETISLVRKLGALNMVAAKKWQGSVDDGIAFLRSKFEKIVIHPRCKHFQDEAKYYRFKVDKLSGDVLPVIEDKHNHGWDAVRYALEPMISGGVDFAMWERLAG